MAGIITFAVFGSLYAGYRAWRYQQLIEADRQWFEDDEKFWAALKQDQ